MTSQTVLEALGGPAPPSCRAEVIDFQNLGMSEYKDCFATLIHDFLSQAECEALLKSAQESAGDKWEQALVNVGGGQQKLYTDVRLCDRILWDTPETVDKLLSRLLPYLPSDIVVLENRAHVTGNGPVKRKEIWHISRLNERLRFLKYTNGMYFREHCDGSYVTPDGKEMSFLTVHLYLNGQTPIPQDGCLAKTDAELPLQGGATRFFCMRSDEVLDVEPQMGACLVFQHRNLVHSGEDGEFVAPQITNPHCHSRN